MRSLVAVTSLVLLGICATSCGGIAKTTNPASRVSAKGYLRGDYDIDDNGGGSDYDDYVRGYGREATAGEKQIVARLVARYYAAAAAGNGAEACALLDARLARSADFAKVLPKEYAPAGGSSVFEGKTCAEVASLLFEVDRPRLATEAASVQVTSLRVEGVHGIALLGFATTPERQIPVDREAGAWKIAGLLDTEVP
jgi:hypothetical protein